LARSRVGPWTSTDRDEAHDLAPGGADRDATPARSRRGCRGRADDQPDHLAVDRRRAMDAAIDQREARPDVVALDRVAAKVEDVGRQERALDPAMRAD